MKVSVCIATYRRTERLRAVLEDLARQSRLPDQVVVVDNDLAGSARPLVEQLRASGTPFTIAYDVQPERNIAMTRNRTVTRRRRLARVHRRRRAGTGELAAAAARGGRAHGADGVLAPVEPQLPADAPQWIRRGRFYDFRAPAQRRARAAQSHALWQCAAARQAAARRAGPV
jgi:succinoglycan biosynthesis protein ExoM